MASPPFGLAPHTDRAILQAARLTGAFAGPVALRPRLTTGLPLQERSPWNYRPANEAALEETY